MLCNNDVEICTPTISEDSIENSDNCSMIYSVHTFSKPVYGIGGCSFLQIDDNIIKARNAFDIPSNHKEIVINEENDSLLGGNSDKFSKSNQTIADISLLSEPNNKELNINTIASSDFSDGRLDIQSSNSEFFFQNNTFTSNDVHTVQKQAINLKKGSSAEQHNENVIIQNQRHSIVKKLSIQINDEDTATEKWKRKNRRQKNSYLTPNSHLKHVNLNIKNNKRVLPLLKNGSRVDELKALQLKGYGQIILTNTCAFDTVVSLFLAAMCDSDEYLKIINQFPGNSFITFTKTILSTGISVDTYRKRAKIIIETQAPIQTPLKYNQIMYKCDITFSNLLNCMIPELPSIYDRTICNKCTEKTNQYCQMSYVYDGNFDNLVECMNERLQKSVNICYNDIDNTKCENIKTIIPSVSDKHVYIDVLRKNEGTVL